MLWRQMPARSYALLLLAIFFTFSTLGFILDLWRGGAQPVPALILSVLYSGLLGVAYGHGAMRNWKFIPAAVIIQIAVAILLPKTSAAVNIDPALQQRLVINGIGLIAMIILGYVFFIIVLSVEGIPHIRLKTEVELARKIHNALVPPVSHTNSMFDIYGLSNPVSEIGGDLIDLYETPDTMICTMADVSGHGVSASLFMGMFKSAAHTAFSIDPRLDFMLNLCNKTLFAMKNRSMFLTVAALQFSKDTCGRFTVAGHMPVLQFHAADKHVNTLSIRQIPVSVKNDFTFSSKPMTCEPGDIFIIFSDGITETWDKQGNQYGQHRLEELIKEHHDDDAKTLCTRILDHTARFGPQHDDQSLVIVKRLG